MLLTSSTLQSPPPGWLDSIAVTSISTTSICSLSSISSTNLCGLSTPPSIWWQISITLTSENLLRPLHFWSPHWPLLISSISTKEQVLPDLIYFMKLIYSLPCHWDLSLWQLHVYLTLAIYLSSLSIWQLHLLIMIGIATILLWYHTILMVLLSLDPYFDDAWVTELEHLSISWHSFCHKPWIDSIPKLQPPTALSEHRNTIGAVTLSAPTAIAYSCTITCFT